MKIELGSGRRPHKGYKTIDVEEYAHPDYLGDFRDMSFENVEEIRSHHLFEHFSRQEAESVLSLWNKWLIKGGKLIIEVPDFEGICEAFVKDRLPDHRYWLCRHAYGSQEAEWAFHRTGYWKENLEEILKYHGFEVIGFEKSISRKYLPNITVVAEKI